METLPTGVRGNSSSSGSGVGSSDLDRATYAAKGCRTWLAAQGLHCSWITFAYAVQQKATEQGVDKVSNLNHPVVREVIDQMTLRELIGS